MAIDYDDPEVIQDAKEKLAEMFSRADKDGKIAIGRGLGYDKAKTNPDSARRSAARLATFRIGKGSKLDVTKYFKDIVFADDPVAWSGNLPPFTAEPGETYYLTAYAVFARDSGGSRGPQISLFDGFITPTLYEYDSSGNKIGRRETGHARPNEIRLLFEAFDDVVFEIFTGTYSARDTYDMGNDYNQIVAIALSEDGVDEIERIANAQITRARGDTFGVTLLSSSVRFTKTKRKKDRKAIARSRASSREFPKRRRKEIIQYIRRSYAQRSRFYE